MPTLDSHQSATTLKMLLIGDSGSGKTGSLASLVKAGYLLRIIDADNGLDVLANLLSKDPRLASRVVFQTVQEVMKPANGKAVVTRAAAWAKIIELLGNWKDGDIVHGPATSWGADTILVIDSLSFVSDYAMNHILQLNNRLNQHPQLQEWGGAQTLVEGLIQYLTGSNLKCHVIVTAHITYIGGEGEGAVVQGYPRSLGKSLPPKISTYFNTMLMLQRIGAGAGAKLRISTQPSLQVGAKNSAPLKVAPHYPIETGLAQYFEAILGTPPGITSSAPSLPPPSPAP